MRTPMLTVVTIALALAASGCATLFSGGPDAIPVATNPPGAAVFVDGQQVGNTPTLIMLDRQRNIGNIRIELPGFQPVIMQRSKSLNGWFIVSICLGIFPAIVDLVTGDWHGFDDTPVTIGLTPAPGYAPPPMTAPPGLPPQGMAPPQDTAPAQAQVPPRTATLVIGPARSR